MLRHLLVGIALILGPGVSEAQDLAKPLLLVAKPELKGPYNHTALLVVPVDGRHIGFILNRATEVKLAALFPDHAPSAKVADPVYFGGPERVNAIFAIVARNPGAPSVRLFGDLHVTAQAEVVDRIIEQTPNDARYFAGFVGWRPGELAAELESGFWYTAEPEAALVFSDDTGAMWESLIRRLGKPMDEGMHAA
ncbi:MAG TPA: YqgE/AlgH family protein [Burkholderiales bacterium]|nr:YqgE/AlgH family protein [Burkholderiales bacterium]